MVARLMCSHCGMSDNNIIIFQTNTRISFNGPANKKLEHLTWLDLILSVVSSIEWGVFGVLYCSRLSVAYNFNLHS